MRSCSSQSSCEAGCGGWPGVDENASWCPPGGGQREFGGAERHANFCTVSRATYFVRSLPRPYEALLFPS